MTGSFWAQLDGPYRSGQVGFFSTQLSVCWFSDPRKARCWFQVEKTEKFPA